MLKKGVKHLIQCRCILPTLKGRSNPPLHSFIVFSIIDENGSLIGKNVSCNNCGVMHHVTEVCTSSIVQSVDGSSSQVSIDDIAMFLPDSVKNILESYSKELPDYEHVKFMIDENITNEFVVLDQEFNEGKKSGKILKYKGSNKFEIEPFSRKEFFDL